ncbi:hypothetical protein LOK49_LG06G02301 [Camellia lanceoleosa]|uniref:Uncharacterized protein n=1 Tax=Camellia lanceoleosa TaxID=1840588 RepID=A0ACC0HD57_9ERIC|nr:hypothetical protein LOK49_LG06G02301 [Camellia lanceoleosa]
MVHCHILLLTFPAQGHINPSLQFAKRLVSMGVHVTFATSLSAQRRMTAGTPEGLKFVSFSDGYDDGFKPGDDVQHYYSQMKKNSSQIIRDIITTSAHEGRPVTSLVYTLLLPWSGAVARDCHVPSILLWIQPAAVLDIYYYYFNGYEEDIVKNHNDPSWSLELPGLPRLHIRDLPSFLIPSSSNTFAIKAFKELVDAIDEETNPKVLVNTCDALEHEALKAIQNYNLIGIGPLIPSAFLDGQDPSDTSFGGDLFQKSREYIEWLNSKPQSSVVYISFGTMIVLPKKQKEEIAQGLLETHRPFLWVMRPKETRDEEKEEEDEGALSCMEELEQQGMIVPWCSQLEVLSHPSLGGFVTHCGWNSALESLASGVPVVAVPGWSDQGTNAKMMTEVWGTGVRVKANEEGIVESEEVKRCIEEVMAGEERGEEMRRNAKKWKELTREAVKEGGSSDLNLKAFVEEIGVGGRDCSSSV